MTCSYYITLKQLSISGTCQQRDKDKGDCFDTSAAPPKPPKRRSTVNKSTLMSVTEESNVYDKTSHECH